MRPTEHDHEPGGEPAGPPPVRHPRRGAFPTPASELEKAERYVPDAGDAGRDAEPQPGRADVDRGQDN